LFAGDKGSNVTLRASSLADCANSTRMCNGGKESLLDDEG
jgi:hypothetical protein